MTGIKYPRWIGVAIFIALLLVPLFANDFLLRQIGVRTLFLSILAMSLVFLAGYGGMVSLAQIALFGVGSYTYAYLVVSSGLPVALGIIGALLLSIFVGVLFGMVAVRTQGIYFLMITLALAMLAFNFALQNRSITRGFSGIVGVRPPSIAGISFENPTAFYYLALSLAVLIYIAFKFIVRTPFGIALQGIRDNPRRMASLGYQVQLHRVLAFTLAAFVAGLSGILSVWFNGQISPGSIDLTRNINVLLIVVLGGVMYFEGAWVGSLFFVLVTTYAINLTNRFNTLIGLAFLLVALFLPQGFAGILDQFWTYLRGRFLRESAAPAVKQQIND